MHDFMHPADQSYGESMFFRWLGSASILLVAALAVPGAQGCWVPNETGRAMQRDIRRLQDDLLETRKGLDEQRAQLTEQMQTAAEQINEVDKKIQELNRAAGRTDAGLGVRMDELQRELQELRGQNELLAYKLGQTETRLRAAKESEAKGSSAEELPSGRPEAEDSQESSSSPSDAPKKAPTDKKGLLAYGKQLVKQGKLEQARGAFRQIVDKWGKDKGYADEALFQLGELYFKEKKYRSALQEYIKVVERFPKGSLVDDAYFRIGMCSMDLGNYEDAQIFFNEVIANHKKSPLVSKAKTKLKEVEKRLASED